MELLVRLIALLSILFPLDLRMPQIQMLEPPEPPILERPTPFLVAVGRKVPAAA